VDTEGEIQKVNLDETQLRVTLGRLLKDSQGHCAKISSLRREPSPFATSFPVEVMSVSLENGDEMSLFVKHPGSEQSDHPDKQRRDREILVYEKLLGEIPLPAVKYYGSRWNEKTKRCDIFLEYIDDWNLKYQDLEHWFTAARRLAQFHAYFATRAERLLTCDFLLRLDTQYLCQWAERALSVVGDQSAELEAKLARVVNNYERVTEALSRQPPTLVHNDLAPKNVMADRSCNPARLYFVDWEMAGVGCGLLDLVHLKYGLDPVNDQKMCAAYCEEMAGTDLVPPDAPDRNSLFAACEVHQTIYRLAHSKSWRLPLAKVAEWVIEAEQFMARI
jgi:hypothetical protein